MNPNNFPSTTKTKRKVNMARSIKKHVTAIVERLETLFHDHSSDLARMIQESESESITVPLSVFISDAPGTQRVSAKMTLTKKEVFTSAVDIDTGQETLPLKDEKVKKTSLKAKQKASASKKKQEKELADKAAKADAPQ